MIVCVHGMWHLGTVTAACLTAAGHRVIGLSDVAAAASLRMGTPPVAEPGLEALLREHAHRLVVTADASAARDADVLWVTYDTPVDDDDRADVDFVLGEVEHVLPYLRDGTLVLVSSQLPVGSIAKLEAKAPRLQFACSPENLRLGKAIETFMHPDRVVVGIRDERAKATITELLAPITTRIEWMSIESAEMTKHAINAFLALSVTFANELATVCERVGADAKDVERGLKTESRIGPRAYLAPGAAFAGGTLARDVAFLTELGRTHGLALPLLGGVQPSNQAHKQWPLRQLAERLGDLAGARIAVWGLTYKPGTDTLRRSAAVELCRDLVAHGATVIAWDPGVRSIPADIGIELLATDPAIAARGASALVVATEWPQLRELELAPILASMERRLVLDANRFLAARITGLDAEYVGVGAPR